MFSVFALADLRLRDGSPGGSALRSTFITCTPRSPILLKLRAARIPAPIALICAEDIFDRVDAVLAGVCLDQIAQNFPIVARLAGRRTARLRRCSRPLPLIIEPRFSAKPNGGQNRASRKRVDCIREDVHQRCKAGSLRELFGRDPAASSGFSPNEISALIWPRQIASSICWQDCAPGSRDSDAEKFARRWCSDCDRR